MEDLRIKTSRKVEGGCKEEEEVILGGAAGEPVSPSGQYYNSSVLSYTILGVLEIEVPIASDDSEVIGLLRNVFLPINPRFSSIMVTGEDGEKQWKRVEVKLEDHLKVPNFLPELSPKCYDTQFDEYLSKLALDPLPQKRPLWEVHIVKYPTSKVAGHVIFKLHHALGDGYSLMDALLSCLQRCDDPCLPLTFPRFRRETNQVVGWYKKLVTSVPKAIYITYNTLGEYGWSLLKSSVLEDDKSPIRSGSKNVDSKPMEISTVEFPLDKIKQIKVELGVTINDVVVGIMSHGVRVYMKGKGKEWGRSRTTILVLMNTRNITNTYHSVSEMLVPNGHPLWGNQFAFLHTPIPDCCEQQDGFVDPLRFVFDANQAIQRKTTSLASVLVGHTLGFITKCAGSETTSRFLRKTVENASLSLSNVVGPIEKMCVANHPVKGLYFTVGGVPQSLIITILSYAGTLRIGIGAEKDFIDVKEFKACLEKVFELTFDAALNKERVIKSS